MIFQKMLKIWQKSGIDKIIVFYKKIKNKKIKKFRKRADLPCECQKRGGGVWFALYRDKTLKTNTLFATKTDLLRQKRQKCGFFVSVFVFFNLSKIRIKARKQKVKRQNVCAKMLENSKFPKSFLFRTSLNNKRQQKASANRVKAKHQTLFRNSLDN